MSLIRPTKKVGNKQAFEDTVRLLAMKQKQ